MIRRRTVSQTPWSNGDDHDSKLGRKSVFPYSDHDMDPRLKPIVPHWLVVAIVVFFLGAGFWQEHYIRTRRRDPFAGIIGSSGSSSSKSKGSSSKKQHIEKKSLLSPEEDAALEVDANTGVRYHLVFSTDCSPYQHWQAYLVYYTAMKVRQPGHVTRIASGCNPEEEEALRAWFDNDVQPLSKRFHLQLTPHFSGVKNDKGETVSDYKFFNKPFGLKYWMENSPQLAFSSTTKDFPTRVQNDVVILIDPDMGLLRPITVDFSNDRDSIIAPPRKNHVVTRKVGPGKPVAQTYGFGTQWARLDLEKIAGKGTPAAKVTQEEGRFYYPVGPPYLATVSDMYRISEKWTEFVPGVHQQYPHLLAEMFAYCIAAAHLQLPHQLIDSLMVSSTSGGGEGWALVDQIPAKDVCGFAKQPQHDRYAVPSVIHLCQRYYVGKDWFFSKRKVPSDIYQCESPLFEEPPDDVAVKYDYRWAPGGHRVEMKPKEAVRESFMLCYLFSIINEAAIFYKENSCPSSQNINRKKSRNLAHYMSSGDGGSEEH